MDDLSSLLLDLKTGPTNLSCPLTPTEKLDDDFMQKYDYTNNKLKTMVFPSREGI